MAGIIAHTVGVIAAAGPFVPPTEIGAPLVTVGQYATSFWGYRIGSGGDTGSVSGNVFNGYTLREAGGGTNPNSFFSFSLDGDLTASPAPFVLLEVAHATGTKSLSINDLPPNSGTYDPSRDWTSWDWLLDSQIWGVSDIGLTYQVTIYN